MMTKDERRARAEDRRRARLAASLRENLKRRKTQSRARAAEAALSDQPMQTTQDDPDADGGAAARAGGGPA
jgi:hypothetical protein